MVSQAVQAELVLAHAAAVPHQQVLGVVRVECGGFVLMGRAVRADPEPEQL